MTQYANQLRTAAPWKRVLIVLVGALAFLPLTFESREIISGNMSNLAISNADVLGTGSLLIFLAMLTITPLITVTGARWIGPLRWWYGVMFFINAAIDLTIAAIVSSGDFQGGFLTRTTGHSFLLVGTSAVLLGGTAAVTANHRSQRWLGKYWKSVQRTVYIVWLLILTHLALLFGFGDKKSLFFYALYASIPLAILRIPWVKRRYVLADSKPALVAWSVLAVALGALFLFGYGHIVSELFNRGMNAISNHPAED